VTGSPNPLAVEHLPFFITPPGGTDVLYNIMLVFVIGIVILAGVFFWTIHSLPERMAHKSKKIQMDIVAVLCLLALFTHEHVFWVGALLLAFIDIPDFSTPLRRMANSLETMAGHEAAVEPVAGGPVATPGKAVPVDQPGQEKKGAARA
jgi:hypothetical protein